MLSCDQSSQRLLTAVYDVAVQSAPLNSSRRRSRDVRLVWVDEGVSYSSSSEPLRSRSDLDGRRESIVVVRRQGVSIDQSGSRAARMLDVAKILRRNLSSPQLQGPICHALQGNASL